MSRQSSLTAAIGLAVVAVSWGAIPLLVRNEVPSTGLVGIRVTLGAIVLWTLGAALRRLAWPGIHWKRLILCGLILAAHWIAFFEAIKHSSVAVALAILYLGPITASILSGPILGEVVSKRLWWALGVAATGTLLVVQPWAPADTATSLRGVLMAALSGALLAALFLVGKPVASEIGGLRMSLGELTVASVVLIPATYDAITTHSELWLNFLVLGALFTGLAGLVYWEAMRRLPIAAVSVIMYLEPASAVVWALVFLDETPNAVAWVGVALVIAGGLIAGVEPSEEEVISAPATL